MEGLRLFTSRIAGNVLIAVMLGALACGDTPPPNAPTPATSNNEPVVYEEISVKQLVMVKPDGKHVRTSGAWGDAQPNVAGVGADAFGVYFYDGAAIIALSVPKALAEEAALFAHGQPMTVEGRFEDRAPFPLVHVDRFIAAKP